MFAQGFITGHKATATRLDGSGQLSFDLVDCHAAADIRQVGSCRTAVTLNAVATFTAKRMDKFQGRINSVVRRCCCTDLDIATRGCQQAGDYDGFKLHVKIKFTSSGKFSQL